jgi:hypothetical protein
MNQSAFKIQVPYDAEKLCALQKYMKDETDLQAALKTFL